MQVNAALHGAGVVPPQLLTSRADRTAAGDVFFAAGTYRPHTGEGRRLIAHELTHVAQQRGAPMTGPLVVSDPGDALERDAERVAGDVDA